MTTPRSGWYCATTSGPSPDPVTGSLRPSGLVHAKTTGRLTTACGQNASSWTKYLDIDFVEWTGEACPTCRELTQPWRR